jgi:ADP-ribose pyrophosphatase
MPARRTETMAEGTYLRLLKENGWEYADRVRGNGVVAIIALTEQDELVLTEQYRLPVRRRVVDLPAGLVGDVAGEEDERFEQAARRELLEETGFQGEAFESLFTGPSSAGMTTELVAFYLTRNVRRVEAGGGDETEEIEVHAVGRDRIGSWLRERIDKDVFIDPKVYAALGLLTVTNASPT